MKEQLPNNSRAQFATSCHLWGHSTVTSDGLFLSMPLFKHVRFNKLLNYELDRVVARRLRCWQKGLLRRSSGKNKQKSAQVCREDKMYSNRSALVWQGDASFYNGTKHKGQKSEMHESSSHTSAQQKSKHFNIVLIIKIPFCISLKYLKMYSNFFGVFFFCKVMLQHVFINHNDINMNDIQNSNNYSHIITLPSSTLATLPSVWPCSGCI